ncbi:MAG: nickel pincer cofactor biosynthesis protein LarB [Gammaproteobacteria bacterium]|nr:nickel pincer cofactor biosynthesis protein LarB [Gammaproteobacteria bacterium]
MCFDWTRGERTGVPEAVLAAGKSAGQLITIGRAAIERRAPVLFTRVDAPCAEALVKALGDRIHMDATARTATIGRECRRPELDGQVAVVGAGSSDLPVALEAVRTLEHLGVEDVALIMDVGVAGLWRLLERVDALRTRRIVIAVAGMEGALFSVVAGLVPGLVIAVPTSVGYGVCAGGQVALNSALAACAPGVVAVNIDNGFGAACAAIKALNPLVKGKSTCS